MLQLGKRKFEPDDAFFEEGNLVCRLLQEKYFAEGEQIPTDVERDGYCIDCQIQGCYHSFITLNSYEEHYAARHRNVCHSCAKILPTSHLLEIHLNEQHNPLFDILCGKSAMYRCLVSGCELSFNNGKTRKKHLIEVHKYPSSYRFERIALTKRKKSTIKPVALTECDVSMETSTEDIRSDKPTSRFKYSYKVPPASFSFGQGIQRGFMRRHHKSKHPKGNHLVKRDAAATATDTQKVDIEDVDMSELVTALDAG